MGWFADETVADRDYKGWEICDSTRKADERFEELGFKPTLQIIYSDRFLKRASISTDAAAQGILPVFKNYDNPQAGHEALRAAVKFIEGSLSRLPPRERIATEAAEDFGRMMIDSLTEPLEQQRLWSRVTLVFVALSILLLLAGATSAIFWNIQVGTLTSTSSLLTSVISSLLFVQLQRARKSVEKSQEKIEREYEKALERLYKAPTANAAPGPAASGTTSS